MNDRRIYVLGPLMGGHGSRAFLGQELSPGGRLRPIVLVFLPEEVIEDREMFARIRHETEQAVRLDHLNVITVLGLIELEDGVARAVEFADAESLRSVFTRARQVEKPIPSDIAASIIADACAGVHHAHEVGQKVFGHPLLHLAVRPETLLVTFKGLGMVTGYGAAAIVEGTLRARGDGSMRDPYTAPEQVYGGRKAATVQTDVYALGTVLFEALSGRPPVESAHTLAIASIDPSRRRLAGVPDDLVEIVMKAISKESKNRFGSPAEFREALIDRGMVATKREVGAFMDALFPADLPQIKARREMLKRGTLEYETEPPTPSGEPTPATLVWRYPVREVDESQPPAETTGEADVQPAAPATGEKPGPEKAKPDAPAPGAPKAPAAPSGAVSRPGQGPDEDATPPDGAGPLLGADTDEEPTPAGGVDTRAFGAQAAPARAGGTGPSPGADPDEESTPPDGVASRVPGGQVGPAGAEADEEPTPAEGVDTRAVGAQAAVAEHGTSGIADGQPAPQGATPAKTPSTGDRAPGDAAARQAYVPPPPPTPLPRRRGFPLSLVVVIGLVAVGAFVAGMYFSGAWGGRGEIPPPAPHPMLQDTSPGSAAEDTAPGGALDPVPIVPGKHDRATGSETGSRPKPHRKQRRRRLPRPGPAPAKNAPGGTAHTAAPKGTAHTAAPKGTAHTAAASRSSTGVLNIKAPAGSQVYIGGKLRGVTPLRGLRLPPGKHKVVVKKKGGGSTYERVVPVQAGRELTLTVEFY